MAKTMGASHVIASLTAAALVITGLTTYALYARARGAEAEAARLAKKNEDHQALVNAYVLATGRGEIVCDGKVLISEARTNLVPLSDIERKALEYHLKAGWCKANLHANNGQQ